MSHERVDEKVQDGPMAVHRPPPRTVPIVVLAAMLAIAGCGSESASTATEVRPTTIPIVLPSSAAAAATTTDNAAGGSATAVETDASADTDALPIITMAEPALPDNAIPTLVPPPTAPPSAPVATPSRLCPGITTLPGGVATGDTIVGNLDGDGSDDTVITYTAADGVPHVFLQRGGSSGSDITLPLGDADRVSISFEDVDHSLGAAVTPPLVVLAIGAGPAGSAAATFLSPNSEGCLQQWQLGTGPFTFSIDQRGPFSGLLCDGAAGRRFYVLRTATPDGAGSVTVTALELSHTGTSVTLARLGDETIPDDPSVARNFGDIQNCDHPPLFS